MTPVNGRVVAILAVAVACLATLAGCGSSLASGVSTTGTAVPVVRVVAAENEYGDVAAQIGGPYVRVTSIESNPNTDPHTYEVSPSVAQAVSGAQVVVQNGLGYDDFMSRIESAAPSRSRRVIDVQKLLALPDSTPNPHLWYSPATMPKMADALAADLSALQPAHAAYFAASASRFVTSLSQWSAALARFRSLYPGTPVATTEPVADYMLDAVGAVNLTPYRFQADVMNGIDPSPQDLALESSLLSGHKVKVLVYNRQVTDSLTESFIGDAKRAGIPIVGVYETMPQPGFDYQSWMLAEVQALDAAVARGTSTLGL